MIDSLMQYAGLGLLGLIAGTVGGLIGVGGATILLPALVIVWGGRQHHLFQAVVMTVNVFVIAPSVRQHVRAAATLRPLLYWTIPSATLVTVAGVYISDRPIFRDAGQGYLQILFGVFLIYVVLYHLMRLGWDRPLPDMDVAAASRIPGWKLVALIGLPTGIVSGLLGIAGGTVAVPCFQLFMRLPLRRAVANSAATILLPAIVGAIAKNASLHHHGCTAEQSLRLALVFIPTAFLGGLLGATLVHRVPRNIVRVFLVLALGYASVRMIAAGWNTSHVQSPPPTNPQPPRAESPTHSAALCLHAFMKTNSAKIPPAA